MSQSGGGIGNAHTAKGLYSPTTKRVVWWYKYGFESCPDYKLKNKPNEPRRRKIDQNSKKEKRIHTATTLRKIRAIPCTNQSGGEWVGVNKPIQSENDL